MGSCVSVHKSRKLSALKLHLSMRSKNEKSVAPSPVKEKPAEVTGGSKGETFFDSQPWLESDCEDDFYSVKGDFTPSRGSTPVHHSFAVGTPPVNRTIVLEGTPGTVLPESPSEKKKRLSELFQERLRVDHDIDEQNTADNKNGVAAKTKAEATNSILPPKSASGTPCASGADSGYSSERTPNAALIRAEDKSMKSAECCIPMFCSNRSFNEGKKKMSPAHSVK
ncbi:uncharacterized protein At3g27210-like isoform X2 [Olea europaea var. sylvestris]|uniref:uncharacterized protein At3g27210-like isoform X2 n=1 Tax=Olea europaea var. sylvestris TaxID=158386 RepID=UPI000C1CFA51|nr:uncharacterized protein At3g27210-like isoform X2 [Olea europaea var. sylvestris]